VATGRQEGKLRKAIFVSSMLLLRQERVPGKIRHERKRKG
jgi:hypothetical protein